MLLSVLYALHLIWASTLVSAHGKPSTLEEDAFQEAHLAKSKRSLGACSAKLQSPEAIVKRNSKREAFITDHVGKRGLESLFPRDANETTIAGCVLTPEGEEGPYYVAGELIRQDIRETQPELDLLLDVQIVNVNTCEPMEGVFVDFWNCNSTGVYSGYEPENTLGETWLRGLQASDENGVVQVLTKFPGWYSGRAQHVHVKAHVNGATLPNNTFSGGEVVHTGQLFFDQSVLTSVNALTPYNEDPNQLTLNTGIISPLTAAPQCLSGPLADLPGRTVDRVIQDQQNTTYYDAFVSIRPLGYDLSYGVIGFINIAIDPDTVPAAAGTNNQTGNSSMPSGGSFNGSMPTGNGSLPSGAMPSGSADVSGGLSSSMNTDIDIVSTASASATVGNGSPTSADDTMGDAATSTSGTVGGAATPSASGGVGSGHDTGSSHRGDRSRGRHHHGQGH